MVPKIPPADIHALYNFVPLNVGGTVKIMDFIL